MILPFKWTTSTRYLHRVDKPQKNSHTALFYISLMCSLEVRVVACTEKITKQISLQEDLNHYRVQAFKVHLGPSSPLLVYVSCKINGVSLTHEGNVHRVLRRTNLVKKINASHQTNLNIHLTTKTDNKVHVNCIPARYGFYILCARQEHRTNLPTPPLSQHFTLSDK